MLFNKLLISLVLITCYWGVACSEFKHSIESINLIKDRFGHATTLLGQNLIVFGGKTNHAESPMLIYNLGSKVWKDVKQLGDLPPNNLQGASLTAGNDDQSLYLYGGQSGSTVGIPTFSSSLFVGKLSKAEDSFVVTWRNHQSGRTPSPRAYHTATYVSSISSPSIVIIGGYDGTRALNDAYQFDISTSTWAALQCESFEPRYAHSATLIPYTEESGPYTWEKDTVIAIVGGFSTREVALSEAILLNLSSKKAQKVSLPELGRRGGHATALVNDKLIVSGGKTSFSGSLFAADVTEISLIETFTTSVAKAQYSPCCFSDRTYHTMTATTLGLIVIGGAAVNNNFVSCPFLLVTIENTNAVDNNKSPVKVVAKQLPFYPRAFHSMHKVKLGDSQSFSSAVFFGRSTSGAALSEIVVTNADGTVQQYNNQRNSPKKRFMHSSTELVLQNERSIVIFGGKTQGGFFSFGSNSIFNDLTAFNLDYLSWKVIKAANAPEARFAHASAKVLLNGHDNCLFIHGGFADKALGDCALLCDSNDMVWQKAILTGDIPSERASHTATFSETLNSIFLFGGQISTNGPDTIASLKHTITSNKLFVLDTSTKNELKSFEVVKGDGEAWPSERSHHASCAIHFTSEFCITATSCSNDWLLVYGGFSGSFVLADLWAFNAEQNTWTKILNENNKRNQNTFRFGHVMSCSVANDAIQIEINGGSDNTFTAVATKLEITVPQFEETIEDIEPTSSSTNSNSITSLKDFLEIAKAERAETRDFIFKREISSFQRKLSTNKNKGKLQQLKQLFNKFTSESEDALRLDEQQNKLFEQIQVLYQSVTDNGEDLDINVNRLAAAINEYEAMNTQAETAKSKHYELVQAKKLIVNVEKEIAPLQQELESITREHAQATAALESHQQIDKSERHTKLVAAQQNTNNLQYQLDTQEQEKEVILREIERVKQKIADMDNEFNQKFSRKFSQEKRLANKLKSLEKIKAIISKSVWTAADESIAEIFSLKHQADCLFDEIENDGEESAHCASTDEGAAFSAVEQRKLIEQQLQYQQNKLHQLQEKLKLEISATRATHEQTKISAKEELAGFETQLTEANSKIERLEQLIKESRATTTKLQEEYDANTQFVTRQTTKIKSLKTKITTLQDKIIETTQRKRNIAKSVSEINDELAVLKSEVNHISQQQKSQLKLIEEAVKAVKTQRSKKNSSFTTIQSLETNYRNTRQVEITAWRNLETTFKQIQEILCAHEFQHFN